MVPITIAAVGPAMLRLAGRHCDGVRLHAFCTRAYAEQVVVPEIEKGLSQSGRKREKF
jgi:alkanesulfonate monooxygenase SsuD/methylene tetrahydromethanopterin reductase-like flavin-dependent oxidoreductase (luciferase family)